MTRRVKRRRPAKFTTGQRVRLVPFEGNPEEFGKVLSVEFCSWGVSYIVRLDRQYRERGLEDDGLREVTEGQLRAVPR
jgi:hypothetical protein